MSSSFTESIDVQPPPRSALGSGVNFTPACWRSAAHCRAAALVKEGVRVACGRDDGLAPGRCDALRFIASGVPEQAATANAAATATRVRGRWARVIAMAPTYRKSG